jgi:hypothetical protein
MPFLATLGVGAIGAYVRFRNAVVPERVYVEDVFSTYLYEGNSGTQTITNGIDLADKGGLVWIKQRTSNAVSASHQLTDTNRGVRATLFSNSVSASDTNATYRLTAFNSNGFSVNDNGAFGTNISGETYVSWTFRKQPKFFDVVTYTGNGLTQTINHNLGSTPGCIIVKTTSTDSTYGWCVFHRSTGSNNLRLNSTEAAGLTFTGDISNVTSSSFNVSSQIDVNFDGRTYVAYLFAHNAGGFGLTGTDNVISCGSYSGNGNSDGPSIDLGFEPQWILVKRFDAGTNSWYINDIMRGMTLSGSQDIYPNQSLAEDGPYLGVGPTATGFKVVGTSSGFNNAGSTYIYVAIRRGMMKTPTSGASVFNPLLSSGSGTATSPIEFDSVWYMGRGSGASRGIYDRLRKFNSAAPTGRFLETSSSAAENTSSNALLWFTGQNQKTLNYSSASSVGYYFRRAPGFFDVVCYTGTGVARTVSHNLGAVPELIFVKARQNARNWTVYSSTLGNTKFLVLNGTEASEINSENWNNTSPTSSVFTVGTNYVVNDLNAGMVAYLFASCPGVSKVGSFTNTGSTIDVDCGFTSGARFVLLKRTNASGGWFVYDTARGINAGSEPYLQLNNTTAEATSSDDIDTYAAGFTFNGANWIQADYLFLAIA